MTTATRSPSARSRTRRQPPRHTGARQTRRSPAARAITRAQLLTSWTSALDAAGAGVDAALESKALDAAERTEFDRRLRAEREWLGRFERESAARFP